MLFDLCGLKKNGVWLLWHSASEPLRQESASSARLVLRRDADLSGGGDSACPVSEMREGETGGVRVAFEKSFLHKEVFFFCREEMPVDDNTGCSQRVEIGLAYC